jgi:alkanesulfonate monooxygenase SsuD/methylene tetrahydromethanopterin reductase-like flavin-dependent oxidoreductase (luciferase family)
MYTVVGEDHEDLVTRFRTLQSWMPGGALDRETLESFMSDTLTGTPDQVLERVARFAELGVEEVIVAPAPIPFALPDPSIVEVFAEAVMPKAREL